jgi:heat shock protein HslJ
VSDGGVSGDWTIEEITVEGSTVEIPSAAAVTLVLAGDHASGRSGCNSFDGTYRVDGDRLIMSELAATAMGCAPELAAIESQVLGVLGSSPRFARDSSRLVITADSVTLRYRSATPVVDAALVGTEWQLDGFIEGSTASTRPGVDRVLLEFSADGSLGGNAGCNALRSSWEIDGDALSIGDVAVTRMSCGPEADAVERLVLGILGDADRYELSGTRLLVWAGDRALDLGVARPGG